MLIIVFFYLCIIRNYNKLEFEDSENQNTQTIAFKVVKLSNPQLIQIKFSVMQITNQKLSFAIVIARNVQNVFMKYYIFLIL